MYKTKNLGLNITEMPADGNTKFDFDADLGDNFKAIDEKTLSHRNITNCLLEVPQDIKCELQGGTLTVKAGTIVTFPYGNEDLTAQYPVGSTFINENFIVYGTYYNDGKFFVRVELGEDSSGISQFSVNGKTFVYLTLNGASLFIEHPSYNMGSGSDGVDDGSYYYTESNSIVRRAGGYDDFTISFPLMEVTITQDNKVTSIDQVFNGMGYIGSTFYVLPNVKTLIPDGRNENGSLKNIINNTDSLSLYTFEGGFEDDKAPIVITPSGVGYLSSARTNFNGDKPSEPVDFSRWYDSTNNYWMEYTSSTGWMIQKYSVIGFLNISDKTINSLTFKTPFHAVDYNEYTIKIAELEAKITALQEALQG